MSDPCDRLRAQLAELTAERDAAKAECANWEKVARRCAVVGAARERLAQLTELREATLAMRALGIPIHGSNQEYEELWAAAAKVDAVLAKLTPATPPPCTCRFDRSDHGWVSKTPCKLHGQKGSP